MTAYLRDMFASIKATPITNAATAATAAGSGDATEVNGTAIDLDLFADSEQSLVAIIFGVTTLTAAKTLSIAANWQQADDSGFSVNAADVGDEVLAASVVRTGAVTNGRFYAYLPLNLQRVSARYVRIQFTPDLSHTGTDTATIFGAYVYAGGTDVPTARFGAGY